MEQTNILQTALMLPDFKNNYNKNEVRSKMEKGKSFIRSTAEDRYVGKEV